MNSPPRGEQLSDNHYVELLLRMLVDREGRVMHGDIGGVEDKEQDSERWIHFHGADGLLGAVNAWLASETTKP